MSGEFPLDRSPAYNNQFVIEGRQGSSSIEQAAADFNVVTPDYFRTLGITMFPRTNLSTNVTAR